MKQSRKTRARARFAAMLALVAVASVVPASAQTVVTPPGNGPRGPLARLLRTPYRPLIVQLRAARLTPEQRQQVFGVLKAHQPEMKAFAEKMRTARQGWQQAGKIDLRERKDLADERTALLQSVRAEVMNLLTPEQRASVEARAARRRR